MYGKTANSKAFQGRSASASLRPFLRGYNDITPDRAALAATCVDQLATMRRNREALRRTFNDLRGADRERARSMIEDLNREIGNLAAMVEDNARARFEEIFVNVANKRLPKEAFLQIVEEARGYWRQEGMAVGLPDGGNKTRNKERKRAQKRRIAEDF